MARIITVVGLGVLVLLGICGCGPKQEWFGIWEGSYTGLAPKTAPEDIAATINGVEVTIQQDGTFRLLEMGILKTGDVKYSGNTAILTVRRIMDRPAPTAPADKKPIEVEFKGPDRAIYRNLGGFHPEPVELKKKAQPSAGSNRN